MKKKRVNNRKNNRQKHSFLHYWKQFWYFIWEDDSALSWIANIVLAFILIRFVVYPGLGLALGTTHPIVAVVSNSMEHNGMNFEAWYDANYDFYSKYGIYKDSFSKFSFKNGFNKGDIMFLTGRTSDEINIGDIIVFRALRYNALTGKISEIDIIHRVINKFEHEGEIYFQTKGDRNPYPIQSYINRSNGQFLSENNKYSPDAIALLDETMVSENSIIGKAGFRVPYLGWIKLWFIEIVTFLSNSIRLIF